MNTYAKYCPNVFLMETENEYKKGDTATITTKYGKEHEVVVFNLVYAKAGKRYYSIVRADGYNAQERAKAKAERLQRWAESAEKKSQQYYEASKDMMSIIPMGQPVHSVADRNYRDKAWAKMGKSVEFSDKASAHESKAEYWAAKANDINLSMPESLEYYEHVLQMATEKHLFYKNNPSSREHLFSLAYAAKAVKEAKANVSLAIKLWGDEEEIAFIKNEENEAAKAKMSKGGKLDEKIKANGGFFAFNTEQFKAGYNEAIENGFLLEGEKVTNFGHGFYVPSKFAHNFR